MLGIFQFHITDYLFMILTILPCFIVSMGTVPFNCKVQCNADIASYTDVLRPVTLEYN